MPRRYYWAFVYHVELVIRFSLELKLDRIKIKAETSNYYYAKKNC